MLAPFRALVPSDSDIEYWALERAAKVLRADPARYQSVEGIEYHLTEPSLFKWEIRVEHRLVIEAVAGLFPLEALVPHEGTIAGAETRPRYPVQIRPVMALIDDPLPAMKPVGPNVHFHGRDHHTVTPVEAPDIYVPRAIIADGHHRVAAAQREGGDRSIMAVLVSVDDTHLEAGAFHRVFPQVVALPQTIPGCNVYDEAARVSIAAGRISVVTPDGERGVEVLPGADDEAFYGIPAGLAARHVLPHLGLAESDAAYVAEIREVFGAVDDGATAVLLPKANVGSVLRAARGGLALPPKSTRFRPKPIRGFLMRPLG